MQAQIVHFDESGKFPSQERCHIIESWNKGVDPSVSIARARADLIFYCICSLRYNQDLYFELE